MKSRDSVHRPQRLLKRPRLRRAAGRPRNRTKVCSINTVSATVFSIVIFGVLRRAAFFFFFLLGASSRELSQLGLLLRGFVIVVGTP